MASVTKIRQTLKKRTPPEKESEMAILESQTAKNDEIEDKISKLYELMSNRTSTVNEIKALLLAHLQEYQ